MISRKRSVAVKQVALGFLVAFLFLPTSYASKTEMRQFAKEVSKRFRGERPPKNYIYELVSNDIAKTEPKLVKYLETLEAERVKAWQEYVDERPWSEDPNEQSRARRDPRGTLGVSTLVEPFRIYKVYIREPRVSGSAKKASPATPKLIGYVFDDAMDHVEGQIIEDGAWMDIYFDENFEFVMKIDFTA
jgi:hypothetical protein